MKTIVVMNPKGGCGKSVIADNLAAAFANAGHRTALADTDPQRSSLGWLERRSEDAAPIKGLDWAADDADIGKAPKKTERLVVDTAAALDFDRVKALVRLADAILVPVLPSLYDQDATTEFLDRLNDLKRIRKNKRPLGLVRNRVRLGARASARLDQFLVRLDTRDAGRLHDRALYNEIAWRGLGVFDLRTRQAEDIQVTWHPVIRFAEEGGD